MKELPIDRDFVNRFKSDSIIEDFEKLQNSKSKQSLNQIPVKSVLSPSAQIEKLFLNRFQDLPDINVNHLLSNKRSGLCQVDKSVLELQFLYGLRISEVLNVKWSDINENCQIFITGKKGSNDRVVYPVKFANFWMFLREKKVNIPSSYNRFYFYRLYKKKGLYVHLTGHRNLSVTHFLRYKYLVSLLAQDLEVEKVKQLIGHKSIKSTIHYVEQICK